MVIYHEFLRRGVPHGIPAQELQAMIGPSQEFCSTDTSRVRLKDLLTRWPFLFSRPLSES